MRPSPCAAQMPPAVSGSRARAGGSAWRLLLVELAADRGQSRSLARALRSRGRAVAFRKIRTLVDPLDGSAHPGINQMRGIEDDDADEAIAGFVREPETRHAGY
jgi:hypothetical protein